MSSAARATFTTRLAAYHQASQEQNLQGSLTDKELHERARLLRNGLAVVGFAILEDFIRARIDELLEHVEQSPLPFTDLPTKLQQACTEGVAHALAYQVQRLRSTSEEVTDLIQETGGALASTSTTDYKLSRLAFVSKRSNLNREDVKQLLAAFHVKNGWSEMDNLARRAGFGAISLRDDFRNAMLRRHAAAHNASHDAPVTDLQAYTLQAVAVAFSFDSLLSRACYRLRVGDRHFAQGTDPIVNKMIGLRFVDATQPGRHRDVREGCTRAAKVGSFEDVLAASVAHARKAGGAIVLRTKGRPDGWRITDLTSGRP